MAVDPETTTLSEGGVRRVFTTSSIGFIWLPGGCTQLAKTGYHTGLIHSVQYLMEKSVCMVSEGHVEPVDG